MRFEVFYDGVGDVLAALGVQLLIERQDKILNHADALHPCHYLLIGATEAARGSLDTRCGKAQFHLTPRKRSHLLHISRILFGKINTSPSQKQMKDKVFHFGDVEAQSDFANSLVHEAVLERVANA